MNRLPRNTLAAIALALAGPDGRAADGPADYAYNLPLTVSGQAGMVAYRLPQALYLHARSPDLNDVRLFDAQGRPLAFAIEKAPEQSRTSRRDLPVKIFPVMGGQSGHGPDPAVALDIRSGPDGRLLSVATRAEGGSGRGSDSDSKELSSLVLEIADDVPRPLIDTLRFSLPAAAGSYQAQVWLEVSDDLKQWDTIGAAELSWLVNSATQTLVNDKIQFPACSFRYARLTWRQGKPLLFSRISAEAQTRTDIAAPSETLLLQASPGKIGQDLVYHASVAIPVEKIGLQFTEQNAVLPVQLGIYRTQPSQRAGQAAGTLFTPLISATFYRITQSGQQRHSGDLPVAPMHVGQWVLRPQAPASTSPVLRLVWSPSTLIFLANGKGPYTLAFGRDGAERAALAVAQVAPGFKPAELLALEQAQAGQLVARQPQAASGIAAATPAGLRIGVLWGVLLLGLAMLGFFAWRLIRQMNTNDNRQQEQESR